MAILALIRANGEVVPSEDLAPTPTPYFRFPIWDNRVTADEMEGCDPEECLAILDTQDRSVSHGWWKLGTRYEVVLEQKRRLLRKKCRAFAAMFDYDEPTEDSNITLNVRGGLCREVTITSSRRRFPLRLVVGWFTDL